MKRNRRIHFVPSESSAIAELLRWVHEEMAEEQLRRLADWNENWEVTKKTEASGSSKKKAKKGAGESSESPLEDLKDRARREYEGKTRNLWTFFDKLEPDNKGMTNKRILRMHGTARLFGMDLWLTFSELGSSMRHQLVSSLADRLELEADSDDGIDLEEDSREALKRAIGAFCDEVRSAMDRLGRSEFDAKLPAGVPSNADLAEVAASIDWSKSLVPVAYLWNPSAERLERVYEQALRRPGLRDGQRDGLLGINAFPSRFLSVRAQGNSEHVIDVRPGAKAAAGDSALGQTVRQAVADEFESETFAETEGIKRTLAVRIRWRDDQEVILFLNFRDDPMDGKLLDLLKESLVPAIDQLGGWLQRHGVRIRGEAESLFEDGRRNIMQEVLDALQKTGDRHGLSENLKRGVDQAFSQAKSGISPTIAVHLVLPIATTESIQSQAAERGDTHYFGGFPPVLRPGLFWIDPESKKVCWSDDGDEICTDEETVPDEWAQPGEDGLKYMVEFQRGSHELNPRDKKTLV